MIHPENILIKVSNLSKVYKLYNKPSDRLKEVFSRKKYHRDFESLSNISIEVEKGACLGVIGDNGAGKSTFLKILAKTLSASSGEVNIKGRVGALLELGTGFHPELTGRQNYYTYAAILGLSKKEIKEREKDILDFAEIGSFIDQALKTYSSGMSMRLGFSIATSINPEILIIDEALSVGDQYFQKKCIDRMMQYKKADKTIVFCSHSMYQVNLLCERTIWLKHGKVEMIGPSVEVTAAYENYQLNKNGSTEEVIVGQDVPGALKRVESIKINNSIDAIELKYGDDLVVDIETESTDDDPYTLGIGINRNDGLVCHLADATAGTNISLGGKGIHKLRVKYNQLPFIQGEFDVVVYIVDENVLHTYDEKHSATITFNSGDMILRERGLLSLDFSTTQIHD